MIQQKSLTLWNKSYLVGIVALSLSPILLSCGSSSPEGTGTFANGPFPHDDFLPRGAPPRREDNRTIRASPDKRRDSARLHADLAYGYLEEKQVDVALEEVRISLENDPLYVPAYNVLALINMELNEHKNAEESFLYALKIAKDDSDTLNNYGWFLCQQKRERESIVKFMEAVKNPLYKSPAKAYLNAAICADRININPQEYLRLALLNEPDNSAVLVRLADMYYKRKSYTQTKAHLARIIPQNYTAESLWLGLRTERKLGDRNSELSYASQLRRLYPNSNEYRNYLEGKWE